ncbi:CLUMA_CG017677, isoform A [Clunio marinus]|uniref:CLUMA_CG017677, isoform A n=1 Tax=Clunio marinus TaxID=568069 RepID=A0A1J1J180_9DIPT|nr:CLUMA_CG017677, isoform A [Clunio marinus]
MIRKSYLDTHSLEIIQNVPYKKLHPNAAIFRHHARSADAEYPENIMGKQKTFLFTSRMMQKDFVKAMKDINQLLCIALSIFHVFRVNQTNVSETFITPCSWNKAHKTKKRFNDATFNTFQAAQNLCDRKLLNK